jgi:hypothetical protein
MDNKTLMRGDFIAQTRSASRAYAAQALVIAAVKN